MSARRATSGRRRLADDVADQAGAACQHRGRQAGDAQPLGDGARRLHLRAGDLGVRVQLTAQRDQLAHVLADHAVDLGGQIAPRPGWSSSPPSLGLSAPAEPRRLHHGPTVPLAGARPRAGHDSVASACDPGGVSRRLDDEEIARQLADLPGLGGDDGDALRAVVRAPRLPAPRSAAVDEIAVRRRGDGPPPRHRHPLAHPAPRARRPTTPAASRSSTSSSRTASHEIAAGARGDVMGALCGHDAARPRGPPRRGRGGRRRRSPVVGDRAGQTASARTGRRGRLRRPRPRARAEHAAQEGARRVHGAQARGGGRRRTAAQHASTSTPGVARIVVPPPPA